MNGRRHAVGVNREVLRDWRLTAIQTQMPMGAAGGHRQNGNAEHPDPNEGKLA